MTRRVLIGIGILAALLLACAAIFWAQLALLRRAAGTGDGEAEVFTPRAFEKFRTDGDWQRRPPPPSPPPTKVNTPPAP